MENIQKLDAAINDIRLPNRKMPDDVASRLNKMGGIAMYSFVYDEQKYHIILMHVIKYAESHKLTSLESRYKKKDLENIKANGVYNIAEAIKDKDDDGGDDIRALIAPYYAMRFFIPFYLREVTIPHHGSELERITNCIINGIKGNANGYIINVNDIVKWISLLHKSNMDVVLIGDTPEHLKQKNRYVFFTGIRDDHIKTLRNLATRLQSPSFRFDDQLRDALRRQMIISAQRQNAASVPVVKMLIEKPDAPKRALPIDDDDDVKHVLIEQGEFDIDHPIDDDDNDHPFGDFGTDLHNKHRGEPLNKERHPYREQERRELEQTYERRALEIQQKLENETKYKDEYARRLDECSEELQIFQAKNNELQMLNETLAAQEMSANQDLALKGQDLINANEMIAVLQKGDDCATKLEEIQAKNDVLRERIMKECQENVIKTANSHANHIKTIQDDHNKKMTELTDRHDRELKNANEQAKNQQESMRVSYEDQIKQLKAHNARLSGDNTIFAKDNENLVTEKKTLGKQIVALQEDNKEKETEITLLTEQLDDIKKKTTTTTVPDTTTDDEDKEENTDDGIIDIPPPVIDATEDKGTANDTDNDADKFMKGYLANRSDIISQYIEAVAVLATVAKIQEKSASLVTDGQIPALAELLDAIPNGRYLNMSVKTVIANDIAGRIRSIRTAMKIKNTLVFSQAFKNDTNATTHATTNKLLGSERFRKDGTLPAHFKLLESEINKGTFGADALSGAARSKLDAMTKTGAKANARLGGGLIFEVETFPETYAKSEHAKSELKQNAEQLIEAALATNENVALQSYQKIKSLLDNDFTLQSDPETEKVLESLISTLEGIPMNEMHQLNGALVELKKYL